VQVITALVLGEVNMAKPEPRRTRQAIMWLPGFFYYSTIYTAE